MVILKSKALTLYFFTDDGLKEKLILTKKFIARKKAEYEELQRDLEMMCNTDFSRYE